MGITDSRIFKDITGMNEREVPEVPEKAKETTVEKEVLEKLDKIIENTDKNAAEETAEAKATEAVEAEIATEVKAELENDAAEAERATEVKAELEEEAITATEPEPESEPEQTPEPESEPEPEPTVADEKPHFAVEVETRANKMRPRKFYDRIGDMAYELDNSGKLPEELKEYILSITDRRPDLVDELIVKHFDKYLARNISEIPRVDKAIRRAADENIEIGLRFVHTKNNEQYSSWDEAVESMREITETYGLKPEDYFKKQYFRIDQPDKEISEDEVQKYISNFRGDKKKLHKKLQIN